MTFDEFKALALNPPYIVAKCVYRVDMHRYIKQQKDARDVTEFEVRLCRSFMYDDWQLIQRLLQRFINRGYFNSQLYALYVYQLPIHKDVPFGLYQRLWVYDSLGNLNAQTMCTSLIEEIDHTSAKFRGYEAGSIRFRPGDIVEVYDRDKNQVSLGVVVKQPPTIEQCWEMHKEVEKACIIEGVGIEYADDNYWLYACDDCYTVVFENKEVKSVQTWDVFMPMLPVSLSIVNRLSLIFENIKKDYEEKCSSARITDATTIERIGKLDESLSFYKSMDHKIIK